MDNKPFTRRAAGSAHLAMALGALAVAGASQNAELVPQSELYREPPPRLDLGPQQGSRGAFVGTPTKTKEKRKRERKARRAARRKARR